MNPVVESVAAASWDARRGAGGSNGGRSGRVGGAHVLVTGGAGYIGSHLVRRLVDNGEKTIVLDNLSNGPGTVPEGAVFYEADLCDLATLETIFRQHRIETVMHLAASTAVGESMVNPGKYYLNNTAATANLLHCAVTRGARNFVFSSSAAVYGAPENGICLESARTKPINPYGQSKLHGEQMLRDICGASAMRHITLRYFNVAGAEADGTLGPRGRVSTHLFKVVCEVATGARRTIEIYGTDYGTSDGTCVRDYIHVSDLATAHVAALRHLRGGGRSATLNCGYGTGFSVREVIRAVERAAGRALPATETARRAGDPPVLVASSERIRRLLSWSPRFDDINVIADTALAWERSLRALK